MPSKQVILYSGSNRSDLRDRGLSLIQLLHAEEDKCPAVTREYIQSYLKRICQGTHVSCFSVLAELAQQQSWTFASYHLRYELLKPLYQSQAVAISDLLKRYNLLQEEQSKLSQSIDYLKRYRKLFKEFPVAEAGCMNLNFIHESLFDIKEQWAGAYLEAEELLSQIHQIRDDHWQTIIENVKAQSNWPVEWVDIKQTPPLIHKRTFMANLHDDCEINDWFFKPLLVMHQVQEFMSRRDATVALSLDWDGCGKIITLADERHCQPQTAPGVAPAPHLFLEGYHSAIDQEQPRYQSARDILIQHLQTQATLSVSLQQRVFHFYDDKYAGVVHDFFKTRTDCIPKGCLLKVHVFDYYDAVEQLTLGDSVTQVAARLDHDQYAPIQGTGRLMSFAKVSSPSSSAITEQGATMFAKDRVNDETQALSEEMANFCLGS